MTKYLFSSEGYVYGAFLIENETGSQAISFTAVAVFLNCCWDFSVHKWLLRIERAQVRPGIVSYCEFPLR